MSTETATSQKTVLHAGAGWTSQDRVHWSFKGYKEIRLDVDPRTKPDVVGSITDMKQIADGSVDGVYLSHTLEHLFDHEVPVALAEFLRVLTPDSPLVLRVPDLQQACAAVADGRPDQPLYRAAAGPITAIDMIFGYRRYVKLVGATMAHRTGFTRDTLETCLKDAGFVDVRVWPDQFDLWGVGHKPVKA
jgi:predicted SAM-dependent methyltransferase